MRDLSDEFSFNSKDWQLVPLGVRSTIEKMINEMSSVDFQLTEWRDPQSSPNPNIQNLAKMIGQSLTFFSLLSNTLLARLNSTHEVLSSKIDCVVQHVANEDYGLKESLSSLETDLNSHLSVIKEILGDIQVIEDGGYQYLQIQKQRNSSSKQLEQSSGNDPTTGKTKLDNMASMDITTLPSPFVIKSLKDGNVSSVVDSVKDNSVYYDHQVSRIPSDKRRLDIIRTTPFEPDTNHAKETTQNIYIVKEPHISTLDLVEQIGELQTKIHLLNKATHNNGDRLFDMGNILAGLSKSTNALHNQAQMLTSSMDALNTTVPTMNDQMNNLQTTVGEVTDFVNAKDKMVNENLKRFGKVYDSKLQNLTSEINGVYANFDNLLDNLYSKVVKDVEGLDIEGLKAIINETLNTTKDLKIEMEEDFEKRDKAIDSMSLRLLATERELSRLNNDLKGMVFETNTELKQIFTSRAATLDKRLSELETVTDNHVKALYQTTSEHTDDLSSLKNQTVELEKIDAYASKRLATLEKFSKKLSDDIDDNRFHSEQNENRLLQVEASLSTYSIDVGRLNQTLKSQLQTLNRDFDRIKTDFTKGQTALKDSVSSFEIELNALSNTVKPVSEARIFTIEKKLAIESQMREELSDSIGNEIDQIQTNMQTIAKTIKSPLAKSMIPKIGTKTIEIPSHFDDIPPPPESDRALRSGRINSPKDKDRLKMKISETDDIVIRAVDASQLLERNKQDQRDRTLFFNQIDSPHSINKTEAQTTQLQHAQASEGYLTPR
eukprot:TRINITY_DN3227_c3_g5_i1.p1 TRINITY_DN3227_c3_g5~~TRINITY_DN3227_c3_g5_i1.p1  ORF type:complete len:775 (+),score=229.35 TRINITY_DN3227_c3_g5_i1:52-2376(+)